MPSIDADAVDFGLRANGYLTLANRWETVYKRAVGLTEEQPAAQSYREIDLHAHTGESMIFHTARRY